MGLAEPTVVELEAMLPRPWLARKEDVLCLIRIAEERVLARGYPPEVLVVPWPWPWLKCSERPNTQSAHQG